MRKHQILKRERERDHCSAKKTLNEREIYREYENEGENLRTEKQENRRHWVLGKKKKKKKLSTVEEQEKQICTSTWHAGNGTVIPLLTIRFQKYLSSYLNEKYAFSHY